MLRYSITFDVTLPIASATLACMASYWHFNKTAPDAVIYLDGMEGRKPVSYRNRQIITLTTICTFAGFGFGYLLDNFIHIPYINVLLCKCYDKIINWFGNS